MKVAIVHDYFTTYAGAERVVEQMLHVFPEADLFALFDTLPESERGFLGGRRATTSRLQKAHRIGDRYRSLLPLFPRALRDLDVAGYDLVVSSSHAFAKGVHTAPGQPHACYCYSPMRWAWDLRDQYIEQMGFGRGPRSWAVRAFLANLRSWDRRNAKQVTSFATLSQHIQERIWRAYNRRAQIIYPPVDVEAFRPGGTRQDYYVTMGRLVPYKRIDLIVEAFRSMPERELVVIGDGPMRGPLEARAPSNVRFLGRLNHEVALPLIQEARAFVFAAEEDFGIAPVEAQAAGTPVIAYSVGGTRDTVEDGASGLFFHKQSAGAICDAIEREEKLTWNYERVRASALRFDPQRFRDGFRAWAMSVAAAGK